MSFKNARPQTQPIGAVNPVHGKITKLPGKSKFIADNVSGGMVEVIDPADISPKQLQVLRNARIRFDRVQRRPGTVLLTPAKPNALTVVGLFFFKRNSGETFYFRFSPSTMHRRNGVWTNIPAGAAVKATDTITGSANFANGETVRIDAKTYTFQTILTNVDGNVFIGAGLTDSLDNLKAAINLGAGAGVAYAALTTLHPTVDATIKTPTTLKVDAKIAGKAANAIVALETAANAAWATATLTGGRDAGSLIGGVHDYFQAAVILNKFVFANNGADVLQEYDVVADTYVPLGNAPKYKYITGFYNRVVGAYLNESGTNGVQLGWSGDGNATEWDPLVDESAGSTPLVESPSDLADFLSGVFGFTNVMAILRQQSIWLSTKKPIPTDPFHSYSAFPGVGCDAPYSAKITQNSLTWGDRRTGTIWSYEPGGKPVPIGRPIEKSLFAGINDEQHIFADYDSIQNEYVFCIPQASGNFVICWTYNFRSGTWDKDEREAITILSTADLSSGIMTIDQLPGTIDGLTGTIDSLSPSQPVVPTVAYGRSDGEVCLETQDDAITVDPPVAGSAGTYETELLSKCFTLPTDDVYIAEIRVNLIPKAIGSVRLEASKDGGVSLSSVSKSKTFVGNQIGKSTLVRWVRQIKCRRYAWRLTASNGQFDVLDYEVHVYKGGESTS